MIKICIPYMKYISFVLFCNIMLTYKNQKCSKSSEMPMKLFLANLRNVGYFNLLIYSQDYSATIPTTSKIIRVWFLVSLLYVDSTRHSHL